METFFARKNYLEIIAKRAEGLRQGFRQNIAIVADESLGKTSLILNFLKSFYDNHVITVYLEIKQEPLDYFLRRFIGALLYNFLKNSELQLKEDLEYLISKSQKYIPQTVEKIRAILESKENNRKDFVLNNLLGLSESINKETSKTCLIIFDEFQNLESLGVKNLYKIWSKALISQKNTMYILLSSAKHRAKQILSKNLSLLFGNFETLEMEPFSLKESDEFIQKFIQPLGLAKCYRSFLVHFTGGHPYYLKVICQDLLKNFAVSGEGKEVSEEILILSLKESLFDEMGVLNLRFSNQLKNFAAEGLNQEYARILYLISSGHNRIKDLTTGLRKQKKYLIPKINRLVELDILQHYGDFFKIGDRLFSFWLRFVYQEKNSTFSADARNQVNLFRNKIVEMMQEFLKDSHRPVLNRMLELLQLFGDESIPMDRKRIKLTQFREIKPLRFSGKFIKDGLLGRSCEDLWIVALKDGSITEEDITEFAVECKKYKSNRMQKKIIVSPISIDSNARLKALEEKILTWDLDNLNFILDLFNKSRIVV
ncbi:MAG: ATP-binding protein [Candidatus Omnitrophica bacterium]|nr:ATP-binding protein [Candidatus Omnitrophota bacterium]MDD5237277.1 ATP-binding protein [Candidatus Omnitrophota bacterium]MDD5610375.1 ATP-binding protein [Candidatus Omnitrophota bacterium]